MSKTLILALILVAASGWAMAVEESTERLPSFSQIDIDQDGGISEMEASQVPGLLEMFAAVDMNDDGWLDENEYMLLEQASSREKET